MDVAPGSLLSPLLLKDLLTKQSHVISCDAQHWYNIGASAEAE